MNNPVTVLITDLWVVEMDTSLSNFWPTGWSKKRFKAKFERFYLFYNNLIHLQGIGREGGLETCICNPLETLPFQLITWNCDLKLVTCFTTIHSIILSLSAISLLDSIEIYTTLEPVFWRPLYYSTSWRLKLMQNYYLWGLSECSRTCAQLVYPAEL